ncbi:MAG TPA: VOC family protein [Cytophagales bacterium]|jgi:catechol 2,3-dioxygenase-like lactoylglutathione lyase family enzyme|nr:VOC family protein [Cytophagales bacterium]
MSFKINFLDHIAIKVKDIEISVNWYAKVLCLKKFSPDEWGEYPVLMYANKSGIAIFPAELNDDEIPKKSNNVRIDHFAFNVSLDDFKKAKNHFKLLNIEFKFEDHLYFHSIYIKDPDDHSIELTTQIKDIK